ncbi:mandelate racemase/muconate lactonizing enzyme family protein [Mesorhizobium sp. 1B3]|uniref:mandelate racemase/muconate lactonizing enzyme family protein n=1 Tax=Mesorhizobium sp. 1B3 TaxID=3243599 RepID=UPI003D976585
MKITELRTYVHPHAYKHYVFIAIGTDRGITGFGEATLDHRWPSVIAGVKEGFRALCGKDPTTIEKHWSSLKDKVYWSDGASSRAALSAIDQALWDIAGKAYNLPVNKLLGGAVRERVNVYLNQWWAGYKSTDDLISKARAAIDRGATALKWYPFGTPDQFQYQIMQHDVPRAIQEVKAVREAVGPSIGLMVDLWRRLDWASAAQFCAGVSDCNLLFVEEPTEFQSAGAYSRLSTSTRSRIAFGERFHSRRQFAEVIEKQAVGLVQPSIIRVGGLSEAVKIGHAAETYSLGVVPHNPHGPVAIAASVTLASVLTNFVILESYENNNPPTRSQFVKDGPLIEGDHYSVSDRPGLGIEIDESELRNLCTEVDRLVA